MKLDDYKKADTLLLEMQRIDETIDHLYGEKIRENKEEAKKSWCFDVNGFTTTFTNKTFNIIVDALRVAYKNTEEEFNKL